jgi:hypothetical protein
MTKYNSMDIAPKDGTPILVWSEELSADGKGEWVHVSWNEDSVNYPNGYIGWRWCRIGSWQDEQGGYDVVYDPKCWTSLPEEPNFEPK